jgi:hypothetical protein
MRSGTRKRVVREERNSRYTLLCVCAALMVANAWAEDPSPGWVVIPVAEYRTLHNKAYPGEVEPEASPVQATLTRIDYDIHVSGDLARGRVNLTIDVLKDGWVSVPIPSGLLVSEARLDNKLVSLVPAKGASTGTLSAVLSKSARSVLALDVAMPVVSAAGNETVTLPTADSGVTRASVELLKGGIDVQVGGGLLSEKSDSGSKSTWVAYGQGDSPLTFTWRQRTEDHRTTQPLRLRGSLNELVSLGEDSTSIYAEVDLSVVQGAARDVRVQLPEKVTINQVSGAMVSDWQLSGGELAVTFLEPVEQDAKFIINGETRLPRDGEITVPVVRLRNAERESGGVAVEVLGAGEIKDVKTKGLEEADASDLGETIANRQSPSLAAFTFRSGEATQPRTLAVNIARYTQQAVLMANVEEARYQVMMSREGKTLVQARYAVRNNQRNFVKVSLPPGATVWSASVAGKPARPGQSPDGSLLLPLEKARAGDEPPAFIVEVFYVIREAAWEQKGKSHLALPALDLPISRTGVLVYYPPLFRVTAEPGSFRTEAYAAPTSPAFEQATPPAASAGKVTERMMTGMNKEIKQTDDQSTQTLIDKFQEKSRSSRVAGILPIEVDFPAYGPSTYLVSELTSEGQFPEANLNYQRDKKAGAR